MKCRRSFDLDLAAYLLDPRDAAWDEFRTHYPFCADCAAEVAAWTAVQQGLAQHPEPEVLLRWSDHPETLEPATRATLAQHLERCPSCSDELRALAGFAASPALAADSARAAAAVTDTSEAAERAPHRAASELRAGRRGEGRTRARTPAARPPGKAGGRAGLRTVRRILWHPALAYAALLLVLLLPSFRTRFDDAVRQRDLALAPAEVVAPAEPARAPVLAERDAASLPAPAPKPQQAGGATSAQREATVSPPREQAADAPAGSEASLAKRRAESPAALADRSRDAAPPHAEAEQRVARPAAPRAAAPEAAPAAAPFVQRAIGGVATQPSSREADSSARMRLDDAGARGLRTLVVTLPPSTVAYGAVEVRVRSASGDHELRDQVRPTPDGHEVALELPSSWLGEDSYLVEVYADGALLAHGSVATR